MWSIPFAAAMLVANPAQLVMATAEPLAPPQIVIPSGTPIHVRLDQSLRTGDNQAGDPFEATLSKPLVIAGGTVLPVGTRFQGHVTASDNSGRLEGRAILAITLDSFRDHGRLYPIATNSLSRTSKSHKKRNGLLIGGGAGVGAAIGAIAGGGTGAALGALAGGGAGTAGAVATGKFHTEFPVETSLVFTTSGPVRM
jgi:hypothetical protein